MGRDYSKFGEGKRKPLVAYFKAELKHRLGEAEINGRRSQREQVRGQGSNRFPAATRDPNNVVGTSYRSSRFGEPG